MDGTEEDLLLTMNSQGEFIKRLNSLEKDFNKTKQDLFYKIRSYYNQSVASTYVKEDDICMLAKRCKELRQAYDKVKAQFINFRVKNQDLKYQDTITFGKKEDNDKYDYLFDKRYML